MATVRDLVLHLTSDADQDWREELRSANAAELEKIRAESAAALERIAASGEPFDFASMVRDAMYAIASITADDIVRYARSALAESETREPGEQLLALGAIWLWGRNTESHSPETDMADLGEQMAYRPSSKWSATNAFYLRWFASLSRPAQIGILAAAINVVQESQAELKTLGILNPPEAFAVHMGVVTSLMLIYCALALPRQE